MELFMNKKYWNGILLSLIDKLQVSFKYKVCRGQAIQYNALLSIILHKVTMIFRDL